jgi:hypothetical protein
MGIKLEKWNGKRSRFRCPQCGKPYKFTRYINDETGEYLAEDVGRCDREISCGYHKSPKEYFQTNPTTSTSFTRPRRQEPEKPIDIIPYEYLLGSFKNYDENHFMTFLSSRFGHEEAKRLARLYHIGTSKRWRGANVFWQMDAKLRLRQCKVMLYHPDTGRRVKSDIPVERWNDSLQTYRMEEDEVDKVYFAGRRLMMKMGVQEPNLRQCFFGEHLLREPGAIAIVESEKTAIVSAHHFPDFIWIATGGNNGARFSDKEVCRVLRGRKVMLFPDLGMYERWSEKAREIRRQVECNIKVSDFLEVNASASEKVMGYDLADYLLKMEEEPEPEPKGRETPPNGFVEDFWRPLEGFEGF